MNDNKPITPRGKRVLAHASDVASNQNHCYVGTEHILLGLLQEEDGTVPKILEACGLDIKQLREKATKVCAEIWGAQTPKPATDLKAVAQKLRELADLIA